MKDQLEALLENAKTNKKTLGYLKQAAVRSQMYELAGNLRDLEKKNFPESDEDKAAKTEGDSLHLLFKMVELNAPAAVSWLIAETLRVYKKKKGKFDLKDAAELIRKRRDIFNDLEE